MAKGMKCTLVGEVVNWRHAFLCAFLYPSLLLPDPQEVKTSLHLKFQVFHPVDGDKQPYLELSETMSQNKSILSQIMSVRSFIMATRKVVKLPGYRKSSVTRVET